MCCLLFFCALIALQAQTPNQIQIQNEVVDLINEARTQPFRFAENYLRNRRKESPEAEECYRELQRTPQIAPLQKATALTESSADHAEDTGRAGITGHVGRNGSTLRQRIERHGNWDGSIAENISCGRNDALLIVLDLLIDEGIADRGHRRNILDPTLAFVGVAVRPHQSVYRFICVLDFARRIE